MIEVLVPLARDLCELVGDGLRGRLGDLRLGRLRLVASASPATGAASAAGASAAFAAFVALARFWSFVVCFLSVMSVLCSVSPLR